MNKLKKAGLVVGIFISIVILFAMSMIALLIGLGFFIADDPNIKYSIFGSHVPVKLHIVTAASVLATSLMSIIFLVRSIQVMRDKDDDELMKKLKDEASKKDS